VDDGPVAELLICQWGGCASGCAAARSRGSGVDVHHAELQHDPMAVASGVVVHEAELQHAHTAASGWASGLDAEGSHGSGMDVQQAELQHDHMAMASGVDGQVMFTWQCDGFACG
jgi:hypothetical protein